MIGKVMKGVTVMLVILLVGSIIFLKSEKEVFTSIGAGEIYEAFSSDEAAANEQYISKVLDVTGTLDDKYVDEQGNSVVILAGETGDPSALITLRAGEDKHLIGYEIGDQVTVRGDCTGFLMEVTFKDGVLR